MILFSLLSSYVSRGLLLELRALSFHARLECKNEGMNE